MIPTLVSLAGVPDAVLPPGVYWATLAEIEAAFATTEHRQWLFEGILDVAEALRRAGCRNMYLGGSFVSARERPNDFDGCWDPTNVQPAALDPLFLNFDDDRAAQKWRYRGEMFISGMSTGSGGTYFEFLQTHKETGDAVGMAERHARQLARYAELSLSLAEDVHASAVAATDPDQKARLANGFHKLGRAMRQSIALEAKFVRDRARDQRDANLDAADARRAAVKRRQDQVRAAVERQIYCEVEPHDAPAWLADLTERLEEEALYDDFDDESVEAHIDRLAADLGLTGEAVRDYVPRSQRPRFLGPRLGDGSAFADLLGDDDDDDEDGDEDEDDAAPDEAGESPETPPEPPPPASTPPEPEAAPEPEPPPEPPPPDPPPPRPPDPEPYLPPWERHPNGHFPGGSGY